jgi:hypothetical protein
VASADAPPKDTFFPAGADLVNSGACFYGGSWAGPVPLAPPALIALLRLLRLRISYCENNVCYSVINLCYCERILCYCVAGSTIGVPNPQSS